jgi:acetolactate synthase-1/2/3 large subunit
MAKFKQASVGRRGFLKGAAAGAAALVVPAKVAIAQQQDGAQPQRAGRGGGRAGGGAANPGQPAAGQVNASPAASRIVEHPGSDHMVDVIKELGFEFVAANPGSSFDGLHESLINYGNNSMPELITCCHEESAVAMAHGYSKIENKPMLVMLHGTVGIQHAAMAMYNAYADRVPIFMIAGLDYQGSVPAHNAIDMAAMCRDFVKWDHQPQSLNQFAGSALRAYKLTMMPPMAPVLLVLDATAQKQATNGNLPVPKLTLPTPPSADLATVREIAKQLVNAENPKISVGKMARSQAGIDHLVELAELLQIPVNESGDRVNFPSRHPLAGTGTGQADVTLNLEGGAGGRGGGRGGGGSKTITISAAEFLATHNFNVLGNAPAGDMVIEADAQTTLPALIEEVQKLITSDKKARYAERGKKHAEANIADRVSAIERANSGWDASPIAMGRLCAELWPLIKNEDWSLVSPQVFLGNMPNQMWNMSKPYSHIGDSGGGGIGYGAPAAVGAALANRKYGRLSINIQGDGDLNYAPGVLWTAVHHKIPLLTIMHNNRGYHAEVMLMQEQCSIRDRGGDRAHIGTKLIEPNIDYATMAKAYGMYGEGPITDPKDLGAALKRGIERVKKGEPVMLDVVAQPR